MARSKDYTVMTTRMKCTVEIINAKIRSTITKTIWRSSFSLARSKATMSTSTKRKKKKGKDDDLLPKPKRPMSACELMVYVYAFVVVIFHHDQGADRC